MSQLDFSLIPDPQAKELIKLAPQIKSGELNFGTVATSLGLEITPEGKVQRSNIPSPFDVHEPRPELNVAGSVVRDIDTALFSSPLGISEENVMKLFPRGNSSLPELFQGVGRNLLRSGSIAGDAVLRAVSLPFMAGAGAVVSLGQAAGVFDRTQAKKAFRDLNTLALSAGVVAGTGGIARTGGKVNTKKALRAMEKAIDDMPEVPKATKDTMKQAAKKAVDDTQKQVGTPEFIPPSAKVTLTVPKLNPKIRDRTLKIFDEAKIDFDPNLRISEQVINAINTGQLNFTQLEASLLKNNFTTKELADLFTADVRESAQTLNRLSQMKKKLAAYAKEVEAVPGVEGESATRFMDSLRKAGDPEFQFTSAIRNLDNIRRGLMVTQPATAARNAIVGIGRVGMDVMNDAISISTERLLGVHKKPLATPVESFANTARALISPTNGPLRQSLVNDIFDSFPSERQRLFLRYSSDVVRGSGRADQIVDSLNILNRTQDFVLRRAKFAAEIDRTLRRKGSSLEATVKEGEAGIARLTQEDIAAAVDSSLDFTFAAAPNSKIAKSFVSAVNSMPFIGTDIVPYPRFLTNSLKFTFEHSPVSLVPLLNPIGKAGKEARKLLKEGDVSRISKTATGATTFFIGKQIYDNYHQEGDEWFELTIPQGEGEEPLKIDTRSYNPLASVFFVADVLNRQKTGVLPPDAKQYMESILGIRGGPVTGSLAVIDDFIDAAQDGFRKNPDVASRLFSGNISRLAGQFLTPLQPISDLVSSFENFTAGTSPEAIRRSTTQATGALNIAPLLDRIPIVKQVLPERELLTRSKAPVRLDPLTRQLTGVSKVEEKTPAEKELTRLGIKPFELARKTNIPEVDTAARRNMGVLVDDILVPMVQSPGYMRLDTNEQILVIRKTFRQLYGMAVKRGLADLAQENKVGPIREFAIKTKMTADERRLFGIPLGQSR